MQTQLILRELKLLPNTVTDTWTPSFSSWDSSYASYADLP